MKTFPPPREAEIQRQILELLKLRGIVHWRQNAGTVRLESAGKPRYLRAGPRGVPDIVGILPGGRFFAVEVKRPGEKPTQYQLAALTRINAAGGVAFWTDDPAEVNRVLDHLDQGHRVMIDVATQKPAGGPA